MAGRSARLQKALAHDCFTWALIRQLVKEGARTTLRTHKQSLVDMTLRIIQLCQRTATSTATRYEEVIYVLRTEVRKNFVRVARRIPRLFKNETPGDVESFGDTPLPARISN